MYSIERFILFVLYYIIRPWSVLVLFRLRWPMIVCLLCPISISHCLHNRPQKTKQQTTQTHSKFCILLSNFMLLGVFLASSFSYIIFLLARQQIEKSKSPHKFREQARSHEPFTKRKENFTITYS